MTSNKESIIDEEGEDRRAAEGTALRCGLEKFLGGGGSRDLELAHLLSIRSSSFSGSKLINRTALSRAASWSEELVNILCVDLLVSCNSLIIPGP
jgi:hypothetical protein